MAILRANDARGLADEQLKEKLAACISELVLERGQIKTGGRTSNPGKIKELRHTISRIRTILHERKLGIARVPVEKKKAHAQKQAAQAGKPPSNAQKTPAATAAKPAETATPSSVQKATVATAQVVKTPANGQKASSATQASAAPGAPVNVQTQQAGNISSPAASQIKKEEAAKPSEKR